MRDISNPFRDAMARFATGLCVITMRVGDEVNGMTATAVSSVSLQPPLVLICIDVKNRSRDLVRQSGAFAINVLADSQTELSDLFAQPGTEKARRLAELTTETAVTGAPIIPDCLAYLDCEVVDETEAGDHTIFIGEVKKAEVRRDGEPLLWYRMGYRRLAGEA